MNKICSHPTALKKGKWKKNKLIYRPRRNLVGKTTANVQAYTECRGDSDGMVLLDDVVITRSRLSDRDAIPQIAPRMGTLR